jgi:peptidoglycan L-alanyl-D-glutamate endopeptidase CwlK
MSRSLDDLDPAFKSSILTLLGKVNSESQDYQLRVFYTLRGCTEQAKLWRQSRSSEEIRRGVHELRRAGADWIADCIVDCGPQHGRWATNAKPGQSWHQWGLAVDSFVAAGGRAVWNSSHRGYQRYAAIAKELGLEAGAYWRRRDAVHVQRDNCRVLDKYTWREVDENMRQRFNV